MSFRPPRWLRGRHAQTMFGALPRWPRTVAPRRLRWELRDGDFVDGDLYALGPAAPLCVICHGLEGSPRAVYVRGLVAALAGHGIAALALAFRGCSGEDNRLLTSYHAGFTADLAHVVADLAAAQPARPLVLAGFSLGGAIATLYLAEHAADTPVRAAAVVSVPWDLSKSAAALDAAEPAARVYRARFLKNLRAKALRKAARFPGRVDAVTARRARTMREFDHAVTAPIHGFAGVDDYWTRCSAGPALAAVTRPLLVVHAEDDPFVPPGSLPAAVSPSVTVEQSPAGGHVVFVTGLPWRREFWAERRIAAWLAQRVMPEPTIR